MGLLTGFSWQAWVFPSALVLTWIVLFLRGTQALRLWFALLSVAGAFVTLLIGSSQLRSGHPGPVPEKYGGIADEGVHQWGPTMPYIPETAEAVVINAVLALIVAVPLAMVVPVVDAIVTHVRRRNTGPDLRGNRRAQGAESEDVRR